MKGDVKVCVIGLWHLGSVVSACLADLGYFVVGVDGDYKRVEGLNKGIPPLFEPGLNELIIKNIKLKKLSYTTELDYALRGSSYVFVAFDTPVNDKDEVDLSEIFDTSRELAKYLENDSVIIVSSQAPVGACEKIKTIIRQSNPSIDFDVAYSPENLRLGQAIKRFINPEMIVIGADNTSTLDKVETFFSVIDAPKVRMNLRTAEMTKHALNAFFATSVSFINEIANICDEVGADALQISTALQLDPRIGQKAMLKPGLGFAGGTLARDLKILRKLGSKFGYETRLIDAVLTINEEQNRLVVKKLERIYDSLKNLTIGVLGLTYKAGTSTLRRSVALEIIRDLVNAGSIVKAYDPKVSPEEIRLHQEFEFHDDVYAVAKEADALFVITDWPEFKDLDFDLIKSVMKNPVIIDARNMLDDVKLVKKGFLYFGIGRGQKPEKSLRDVS